MLNDSNVTDQLTKVRQLVKDVNEGSIETRLGALNALGEVRLVVDGKFDERPFDAAILALSNASTAELPAIRIAALMSLSRLGGKQSVECIVARLKDPDISVRVAAASLLKPGCSWSGNFPQDFDRRWNEEKQQSKSVAARGLIEVLRVDASSFVRSAAAISLGSFTLYVPVSDSVYEMVLDSLIAATDDPDRSVVKAAIHSLTHLGKEANQRLIKVIARLFADEVDALYYSAAQALSHLTYLADARDLLVASMTSGKTDVQLALLMALVESADLSYWFLDTRTSEFGVDVGTATDEIIRLLIGIVNYADLDSVRTGAKAALVAIRRRLAAERQKVPPAGSVAHMKLGDFPSIGDAQQRKPFNTDEENHQEQMIAATLDSLPESRSPRQTIVEEDVRFTVWHPVIIKPDVWNPLLFYLYLSTETKRVAAHAAWMLRETGAQLRPQEARPTESLIRGADVLLVPVMQGCEFNPSQFRLQWQEDFHHVEFRMRASAGLTGFKLGEAVNGRVDIFVGPVLVGSVKIWAYISNDAFDIQPRKGLQSVSTDPYRSVFVSYSHEDSVIVEALERAYEVLGIRYLRDVHQLRSGEMWNLRLLQMIDEAEVFQLCWSYAAKQSLYVEREWRHALTRDIDSFIRPMYWEQPMPAPPSELEHIHFAFWDQLITS